MDKPTQPRRFACMDPQRQREIAAAEQTNPSKTPAPPKCYVCADADPVCPHCGVPAPAEQTNPSKAPAAPLRMLTEAEATEAWDHISLSPWALEISEEVQRKFCEVNGLTLGSQQ